MASTESGDPFERELITSVTLHLLGYDGTRSMPSLWQEAAEITPTSGTVSPIGRIGVSMTNPFIFYLFASSEEHYGPNGSFLGTVNVLPAIRQIIAGYYDQRLLAEAELDERAAAETGVDEHVEELVIRLCGMKLDDIARMPTGIDREIRAMSDVTLQQAFDLVNGPVWQRRKLTTARTAGWLAMDFIRQEVTNERQVRTLRDQNTEATRA